jgi:hypothetical protein
MTSAYAGIFPKRVTLKISGQVFDLKRVVGQKATYNNKNNFVSIEFDEDSIFVTSGKYYNFYDKSVVVKDYYDMEDFLSYSIGHTLSCGDSTLPMMVVLIGSFGLLVFVLITFGFWGLMWGGIILTIFSVFKLIRR